MFSLKKASVFSIFVEAMLYGFSVLMFMLTMWILLGHQDRRSPNYIMLTGSCALFVLSTAEMGVNIARIYQAFISVGPHVDGGPDAYFENLSHITYIVKSCLYGAQTLIIDGVVIYRAYVVWQSILVVVLPALAWCGLLVAAVGSNTALILHGGLPFIPQVMPWITSLYILDLSTNFLATALLSYRLWVAVHRTSRYRSDSGVGLAPVLRVVIESGTIYSVTVGAGMVLFLLRSNAVYILMDMTSPIISIVFNMIVVRVGLAQERRAKRCSSVLVRTEQQTSTSFVAVAVVPQPGPGTNVQLHDRPASDAPVELNDVTLRITRLLDKLESPLAGAGEEDVGERQDQDVKTVGLGQEDAS